MQSKGERNRLVFAHTSWPGSNSACHDVVEIFKWIKKKRPVFSSQSSTRRIKEEKLVKLASLASGCWLHARRICHCSRHHFANMTDARARRLGALLFSVVSFERRVPVKYGANRSAAIGRA